jgi:Ice-binding-like
VFPSFIRRTRGNLHPAAAIALFALTAGLPGHASAAIVPTVGLATAAGFSVLADATVTNTGPSTISRSVGVHAGSSVIGLDATNVLPPATIEVTTGVALQAKIDLTAAYTDAANRPVDVTLVGPELTGLVLGPGVYSGPSKSPLQLSGSLVLDGQGDPSAVFIFQTDSSLTTMSGSSVSFVNGASACNVFWQVGSSAVLGSGSVFVGTVMAGASIDGRVLARNGAVTLDDVTIGGPSCVPSTAPSPTTAPTATTVPASPAATTPSAPAVPNTAPPSGTPTVTAVPARGAGSTLPRTGLDGPTTSVIAALVLMAGAAGLILGRRPGGRA